jgi:hypothetical protein
VVSRSIAVRTGLLGFAIAAALLLAAAASALSFPLNTEFDEDPPVTGNFGNVEVTEVTGGDLFFEITLTDELGPNADLHEFYFNLPNTVSGLTLSSTDVVNTPYDLDFDPSVSGNAGSDFVWAVNLGSGAGMAGNGVLKTVTFTLSANQDLSTDDLLIESSTNQNIVIYMAAHVQGTDLTNRGSETVGSLVPEPTTFLLGALGLAFAGGQRFARATRLRPRSLAS